MLPEADIRVIAGWMLEELRQLKQTVCIIPDGRPNSYRGLRCVVVPNPDWYSRLCQQYVNQRRNGKWKRPRTLIKRFNVIHHLERISSTGLDINIEYHRRLSDAIEWVAQAREWSTTPVDQPDLLSTSRRTFVDKAF